MTEDGLTSEAFFYGTDYYPEHSPVSVRDEDIRLMRQAGFNVVRMAEFAWCKLEPARNDFDFGWLDECIAALGRAGIKTVLGTPTAAPPAWIVREEPDILPVDQSGVRMGFGGRRHYCPNNPAYRAHTVRIVEAMGRHYGRNPNVIGWQIDNEFGGDGLGGRCYCDHCRRAFIAWLERKYLSLDRLNESWGTMFWSQTYGDWEEIPAPRAISTAHNPGLLLDYYRFCSDSWVAYQRLQIGLLNVLTDQFITHNLMGLFSKIDYAKLASGLDFVAWDNYPRLTGEPDPARIAMSHDVTRGLKRRGFWVMEEQSGPGGWEVLSSSPKPGEVRLWAYQAIARGAKGLLFFRWDTCRFGTEQYWHGLLAHDRTPQREFAEAERLGRELQAIAPLLGEEIRPEVCILRSYDVGWAFEVQPNSAQMSYDREIGRYYRALFDRGVLTDVCDPEDALFGRYRLIIAPCLYVVSQDQASRLKGFVCSGGTLVLTYRSGVKDRNNAVASQPLPGLLAELAGITVGEYVSLGGNPRWSEGSSGLEAEDRTVRFVSPDLPDITSKASVWCDILQMHTAESIACYDSDFFAGRTAITLNHFGKGRVIYVGTSLDEAGQAALTHWFLGLVGIRPPLSTTPGVEVVPRQADGRDCWFIINHGPRAAVVTLPGPGVELLSGQSSSERVSLDPYEVRIIRLSTDSDRSLVSGGM